MSTPHIEALSGDFAETILLPGDPLRAAHIANHILQDAIEVTKVRAMSGFTGTYRGQRVSVMGTGMGIPSASIYAHELITHYGVKKLIRIGTCGGVSSAVQLGDIVLAQGASTDSGVNRSRFQHMDFAALAAWPLLSAVAERAKTQKLQTHIGNVFSADLFYHPDAQLIEALDRMNILGIEMEAAGLYGLAAQHRVEALAVCMVSDHLRTHAAWSPEQRRLGLDQMVRLVLDAVLPVA